MLFLSRLHANDESGRRPSAGRRGSPGIAPGIDTTDVIIGTLPGGMRRASGISAVSALSSADTPSDPEQFCNCAKPSKLRRRAISPGVEITSVRLILVADRSSSPDRASRAEGGGRAPVANVAESDGLICSEPHRRSANPMGASRCTATDRV